MNSSRALRGRRGFSLIELLVVIAIIAILAAILFPVFASAKEAAKKTQDISNIKNILLAEQMYRGDYDGVYVMLRNSEPDWGCAVAGGNRCVQVNAAHIALNPYVKNQGIWKSPNDFIQRKDGGSVVPGEPISYTFHGFHLDHLTNANFAHLYGVVGYMVGNASDPSFSPSLSEGVVGNTGQTVILSSYYSSASYWNGQMWRVGDLRWLVFDSTQMPGGTAAGGPISLYPKIDTRAYWTASDQETVGAFAGQTNYGFADGHAKSMRRNQVMDGLYATNGDQALYDRRLNLFHYDESYKY